MHSDTHFKIADNAFALDNADSAFAFDNGYNADNAFSSTPHFDQL